MDRDLLEERAEDPRMGHPYFDGVDDMIASWVWHLAGATPSGEPLHQPDDGTGKRYDLHGGAPEHGELVVPVLHLPAGLLGWWGDLLEAFIDLLIQDVVSRVWDRGGPTAVIAYLARFEHSTENLVAAIRDDMLFLGMVAHDMTCEMLCRADRLRSIVTSFGK